MASNMLQGGATAQAADRQDTIGIPDMGDLGLDAAMMGEYIQDTFMKSESSFGGGITKMRQTRSKLSPYAINPTGVVQNPEAQGGT